MRRVRRDGAKDSNKSSPGVLEDVVVREAKDGKTRSGQPRLALRVVLDPLGVNGAIGLDDQRRFGAEEVDDEPPQGLLPSKLEPCHLASSQE
jgi:hypothetical protein